MKKIYTSDRLKMSTFSSNISAKLKHKCKLHARLENFVSLVSSFFSCTLLTSNNMISLAIWCNKHLEIFERLQTALALQAHAILLSLKFYLCL